MSFRLEISNVKESLTQLYNYVARLSGEGVWKSVPNIADSPMETKIKFPHPQAVAKDLKTANEPFSNITIQMSKPYTPQLSVELVYDNKKSAARFCDMLHDRNKSIREEFFSMVNKLDGFSVKIQVKNTFKALHAPKYEDFLIAPAQSVSFEDVVENIKKVTETCESIRMVEEGKLPKYRGLSVSICRIFSAEDLAQENSSFADAIPMLHTFMLLEAKILSEKDIANSVKERKKIGKEIQFHTIVSNRVNKHFFSRLSKAEFERMQDTIGVQVWDTESFEEKKYIRAALKVVSEV